MYDDEVIKSGICYDIHTRSPTHVKCLGSFMSLAEVSCSKYLSHVYLSIFIYVTIYLLQLYNILLY